MTTPALLIFDLDGTLYRTESSFLPTVRQVFKQYGIGSPSGREIMGHVGEPFSAFLDWAIEFGLPTDRDALARTIADAEYASIRERGELFPGVIETLRTLRKRGHPAAICTNGDQEYTSVILGKFGMKELFDEIRTHEDSKQSKTEMISELRTRWPRRSAYVVGDRYHDMEAGRANGCVVVGAAYGYGMPGELKDAAHRITELADLIAIIDRTN